MNSIQHSIPRFYLRKLSFFAFIVLIVMKVEAQESAVHLNRLSVKDGLSQVSAYEIHQDSKGFIWIGTDDGLNRYDGYEFMVFMNDPTDTATLSNNTVNVIYEDKTGVTWVGTDQGLCRMDQSTGLFRTYKFDFHDETSISSNSIWAITEDGDGGLWIGTNNGLNRFQREQDDFVRFKQMIDDETSLNNNNINSLFTDKEGKLWIGTNQGLNLWQKESGDFLRIPYAQEKISYERVVLDIAQTESGTLFVGTTKGIVKYARGQLVEGSFPRLKESKIQCILPDKYNDIWIGTDNGLYQYDSSRNRLILFKHQPGNDESISNNNVVSLFEDSSNIIWIGTYSGGVNIFYREQQQIFHYDMRRLSKELMPSNNVLCIEEVSKGQYWLGTSAGLGEFHDISQEYEGTVPSTNEVGSRAVKTLLKLPTGKVAIGLSRDGLGLMDIETQELTWYQNDPIDETSLSGNRVSAMLYCQNSLWIGTQGRGLSILHDGEQTFERIQFDPSDKEGLRDNRITALDSEGDDAVWIGTASTGIYRYDLQSQSFDHYRRGQDSTRFLSNEHVLAVLVENGTVWVGTRGGGLNRINHGDQKVKTYTSSDGLANNVVHDIVSDGRGRLWMTTNKGVSVLDIENENFINYNESDGLGNQSFNPESGIRTSNDEVIFGGIQGMDRIKFRDLQVNTVRPRVYFTEVEAFNKKSNTYDKGISGKTLGETNELVINNDISLVTLGFAALNYRQPEKNQYAYRISGQNDEWTYIGNRRYVTFADLTPGTYSVQVKAANNDGIWSEEVQSMRIEVVPAFYQTRLFNFLLVVAILALAYFFYILRVKRLNKVNRMLEEKVKTRTNQIRKERDDKVVLLQEIHHRVKNNLQIINSLLRLQSHYVKDEEALYALNESQNRVMSMAMIHEKMYKTENLSDIDLNDYVSELAIEIITTYDLRSNVALDLDIKVGKFTIDTLTPLGLIMNEVITNAMKYAYPEGRKGVFTVHLDKTDQVGKYKLTIGDDGVGMPIDLTDEKTDSLGSTLIESLTEQLNGEIKMLDGPGTIYELVFEDIHTEHS